MHLKSFICIRFFFFCWCVRLCLYSVGPERATDISVYIPVCLLISARVHPGNMSILLGATPVQGAFSFLFEKMVRRFPFAIVRDSLICFTIKTFICL